MTSYSNWEAIGDHQWRKTLQKFSTYGLNSFHNKAEILKNGDEFFTELFEKIKKAKRRIWINVYIFDDSKLNEFLVEELIKAKERGVDVCLCVDYCGGFLGLSKFVNILNSFKIDLAIFNPMMPYENFIGPPCFRNHRKIFIIDEVGYCGSLNMHRETFSTKTSQDGLDVFSDVMVKLEGPAVIDLSKVFCDSLEEAKTGLQRKPIEISPSEMKRYRENFDMYVQVLDSNARKGRYCFQNLLRYVLRKNVQNEIFITSSYFIPPGFLKRSLLGILKRKNAVKVSLLSSGESDIWPVPGDFLAQNYSLRRFLQFPENFECFLTNKKHMHCKFTTIDGKFSLIGSSNYDRYSMRRNLECNLGIYSEKFAQDLKDFQKNLKENSSQISLADWKSRSIFFKFSCFFCHFLYKYSGKNLCDGFDGFLESFHTRREKLKILLNKNLNKSFIFAMA